MFAEHYGLGIHISKLKVSIEAVEPYLEHA